MQGDKVWILYPADRRREHRRLPGPEGSRIQWTIRPMAAVGLLAEPRCRRDERPNHREDPFGVGVPRAGAWCHPQVPRDQWAFGVFEKLIGAAGKLVRGFFVRGRIWIIVLARLSGRVSDPQANNFRVAMGLIRNGFFEAILPGFLAKSKPPPPPTLGKKVAPSK